MSKYQISEHNSSKTHLHTRETSPFQVSRLLLGRSLLTLGPANDLHVFSLFLTRTTTKKNHLILLGKCQKKGSKRWRGGGSVKGYWFQEDCCFFQFDISSGLLSERDNVKELLSKLLAKDGKCHRRLIQAWMLQLGILMLFIFRQSPK